MPAVQLRSKRKKSQGKCLATPPEPHSRQGSVRSNDTKGQRSDDERGSFDKNGNDHQSFSSFGQDELRRKTTQSFDDYEFRKRMEYTLYTGAVLLTTGAISMIIGIMMDFISIHRIGMFLTIVGIILCLIKLFASEHARYQKSIRIHSTSQRQVPKATFDSSRPTRHGRSKSLHHVKTPSEVPVKNHRLSVHPGFEGSSSRQSIQHLNRKKSASYSQEYLRQKLQKELESRKSQSSTTKPHSSNQEEAIEDNSRFQDNIHYSSSHSSSMHHLPDGDYSSYSSPKDPSHLNDTSPCPSSSRVDYQSPGHVDSFTPCPSIRKSIQNDAIVIEMSEGVPSSSTSFLPRSSFHSRSIPPPATPRIHVTDNNDTFTSNFSSAADQVVTRSYSCPSREGSNRSREHPPLRRSGHPSEADSEAKDDQRYTAESG